MSGNHSSTQPGRPFMNRGEIYYYLRSRIPRERDSLLSKVSSIRRAGSPNLVYCVGVITISSHCVRNCIYCSFRADRTSASKFRLSRNEIMEAAERTRAAGIKYIMLYSADDPTIKTEDVIQLTRDLKNNFDFDVTLSMGEKEAAVYNAWSDAGARSYCIRHETCDPHLYRRIRPSMFWVDRIRALDAVKASGLRLATGIMVGMPNQSFESLVEDIVLFQDDKVFGVVVEPYSPPVDSPGHSLAMRPENLIVNPDLATMEKVIAITRINRPDLIIPLTNTHLKLYDALSDKKLFTAGANAVLLEMTPSQYMPVASSHPCAGWPADEPGIIEKIGETLDKGGWTFTLESPINFGR